MILCHPLKIIYLKTKKVGGTSFEVALSKYCSDDCIITPVSSSDERVRCNHGFLGPINHLESVQIGQHIFGHSNYGISGDFASHCSAEYVKNCVGESLFRDYTVVSIHRQPQDFLISQYFFRMRNLGETDKTPFADWYEQNKRNVLENFLIAPLKGSSRCDVVFDYEKMHQQIPKCDLFPSNFHHVFSSLRLKANLRSEASQNIGRFYASHGIDPSELDELIEPYR